MIGQYIEDFVWDSMSGLCFLMMILAVIVLSPILIPGWVTLKILRKFNLVRGKWK